MRTFINGAGADTTATVLAYLKAGNEFEIADLYLIGDLENPLSTFLTDWDAPLDWPIWGKFLPTAIKRGKVTSQAGLIVDSMDVTWSPRQTAFGTTLATMNFYQRALSGYYDSIPFRVWRVVMPTKGDANTYGACEWFGGRVATVETSRLSIKFTVNSFLDVINQKVPPNVIETSNTLSSFAGNVPVLADLEKKVPVFTVKAPSNNNNILGDCVSPNAHKIYGTGKLNNGFLVFLAGSTLAGFWAAIATNTLFNAGGGIHYNDFVTYQSFPFAPTPGDQFYVSTQWPINLQAAQSAFVEFLGFPYVPDPTTAI